MFLVSNASLLSLLSKCQEPGCGAPVSDEDLVSVHDGAAIHVTQTCSEGHKGTWHSSDTISDKGRRTSVINIMLVVYIFLTGLHYGTFKASL